MGIMIEILEMLPKILVSITFVIAYIKITDWLVYKFCCGRKKC